MSLLSILFPPAPLSKEDIERRDRNTARKIVSNLMLADRACCSDMSEVSITRALYKGRYITEEQLAVRWEQVLAYDFTPKDPTLWDYVVDLYRIARGRG